MNLKFTLFLIAAVQLLLLETCHCRPIFSYIDLFGEDTEPAKSLNEIDPIPNGSDITENTISKPDPYVNAKVEPVAPVASAQTTDQQKKPFRLQPTDMTPTQQLGNGRFPWALNTIAMAARLLNGGIKGSKALVKGSTDLTAQALGGVRRAGSGLIDGVQEVIDKGAEHTLNRVSGWIDTTDTLRKGLSGTTAKPDDRGHSITITTNSKAPVTTFNNFISKYLPSGATSGASLMPEITSIDLSKLWW